MNIFCVTGGSGSTYLAKKLRERFCVLDKPDAVLRPLYEFGRPRDYSFDYDHLRTRSPGFFTTDIDDVEAFAAALTKHLAADPQCLGVLNTLHEFSYFSRNRIGGVGFLFRRPLDSYLSFSKNERHGAVIRTLGGITSPKAMNFYARKWTLLASEFLALEAIECQPWAVRYETFKDDFQAVISNIELDDFEESRVNYWPYDLESKEYFLGLVRPLERKIYRE